MRACEEGGVLETIELAEDLAGHVLAQGKWGGTLKRVRDVAALGQGWAASAREVPARTQPERRPDVEVQKGGVRSVLEQIS